MDGSAYIDGEVVDLADARIPLNDRGHLLGDGVFETLRADRGQVFRADDHRARILHGMMVLGLGDVTDEYDAAVDALLDAGEDLGDSLYLRINVSTGPMEDIAGLDRGISVTGVCKPFRPYPMQYYSRGVSVVTTRPTVQRNAPWAGCKTLSFLPYVMARREAMSSGAHDGVLLNDAGDVAEASTSNLFAVKDGVVRAPGVDQGAVDGVTRRVVLELMDDAGIEHTSVLPRRTFAAADEAFLTNTTGGVVPVTSLDGRPIGDGKKGPMTTRLSHALEDLRRGR